MDIFKVCTAVIALTLSLIPYSAYAVATSSACVNWKEVGPLSPESPSVRVPAATDDGKEYDYYTRYIQITEAAKAACAHYIKDTVKHAPGAIIRCLQAPPSQAHCYCNSSGKVANQPMKYSPFYLYQVSYCFFRSP